MKDTELAELQANIMRRLAAVKLDEPHVNEVVVAAAMEKFFQAVGRPTLPIKWAHDGRHAHELAARSEEASGGPYEDLSITKLGSLFERDRGGWVDARDAARAAANWAALESVKRLMHGYPVHRSIPWSLYRGRMTGTRGTETSPEHSPAWQAAGDALECAARAAAECAWAHYYYQIFPDWPEYDIDDFEEMWFPFVDAYEAGLWLFWLTDTEVIALPRPILQVRGQQLHSEPAPAVRWPAGEEEYFVLNDVLVPREIVETPANALDPRLMLHERNTEVRREIVRKIGIERVCEELDAKCIDSQGDYELLLLDLQDGRHRPYLKMKNPSIGVYHIEGVLPGCETVAQALAWRNQSDIPPSVLT